MRKFTLVVALLGLLGNYASGADTARPNIVYFLVDDLCRADVGFNGSKQVRTPNIDRLAKEGAVLDSYYVQPVCSPTRAALLTGRYPTHTGVYKVVRPRAEGGLPLAEKTLAQGLHEAGYTTAICGKWHLGDSGPAYMPTKRGFDHQYGLMSGAIDYFTHRGNGQADWYRDDQPLNEPGYSTHLISQEARRLIGEQPAGKPLFLYVAFNGVHVPHQVPEEYTAPYRDLPGGRSTMAGMISAVDEAIGQIVGTLEEKGLKQNTLMIFSSDNGGPNPPFNAPFRAGKTTIYEGGVRVCAAASWPGHIPAGVTIKEPMHIVDWYPTLLKLAGAPVEQKLPVDGLDVWPMLTKGARTPHDAILLAGDGPERAGIRMGDWKLLQQSNRPRKGKRAGREGGVELYNLAQDIRESKNLLTTEPEKTKELSGRLDAFLDKAVTPSQAGGRAGGGKKKNRMRPFGTT